MGEKVTRVITFDDVPVAKPADEPPAKVGSVVSIGHQLHDVEVEMRTHDNATIRITGQGFIEVTEVLGKDDVRKSFKVTMVRAEVVYEKPFHPAIDGLDF